MPLPRPTEKNIEYSDNAAGAALRPKALRRALTTPHKPQRELVGKKKRVPFD
jgi:hypothetical protein